jgi:hypothetical protein
MEKRLFTVIPLLALAAGCGGSSKGASAPPSRVPSTVAVTTAPASVAPSSVAQSPSAAPSTTAPSPSVVSASVIGRCHTSQLKATVNDGQGAAGTIFTNVLLLNTSKVSCRIVGYPGLGLKGASGADLPSTVSRGGGMLPSTVPVTVTLAPAVSASFTLTFSDNPTGSDTEAACPAAATLVVTPPDEKDPLTTPFSGAPCEGRINVSPVVAGTHGIGS